MTLWVLAAGIGFGAGLMMLARGVLSPPRRLAAVLADLHGPTRSATGRTGLARVLGTPNGDALRVLALAGRDPAEQAARRLMGAAGGAGLPLAAATVVHLGGSSVSMLPVLVAAMVLAAAGFWIPVNEVRDLADSRRSELREATAVWLQLVAVLQAGGAGTESAQLYAAERGDGWALRRIAEALRRARLVGEPTWAALDRLGAEAEVVELRELAASLRLADERGAHVRATLLARARALRTAQMLHVRTTAEQATERMTFPMVLLLLGFLLFLAFPAFMAVVGVQ